MDAHTGTEKTPLNFKQAAAVCIFHGGSVCLGLRASSGCSFSGYWAPFGGVIEEGENPMLAAVRELKEETKISLEVSDLQYMQEIQNDNGCRYILYAYHSPELLLPTLNFEHLESGYFRIDSIKQSPSPVCPQVANAILSYEARRWKP